MPIAPIRYSTSPLLVSKLLNMALPNVCIAINHLTRGARRMLYSMRSALFSYNLNSASPSLGQLIKARFSIINIERADKSHESALNLHSDLIIIGGGVCGIAVAAYIVELVKKGKKLRLITLVEKKKDVGSGLAYSDACIDTILNMQGNIIGIYADDPEHFTRWTGTHFPNLKDVVFPPR